MNCDEAFEVGTLAVEEIENSKTFNEIHLKIKLAVKSLASITKSRTINKNTVCVNPYTLLHRVVCIVRRDERFEKLFQMKLCAYPPFIFDISGLMRKGNKSSMVTDSNKSSIISDSNKVSYTVDGGHLLDGVVWRRPSAFSQI